MEQTKDLIEKYTEDYRLDQQTRTKAEELYKEYISKQPNTKPVSVIFRNLNSHNLMQASPFTNLAMPLLKYLIAYHLNYSWRITTCTCPWEMRYLLPPKVNSLEPLTMLWSAVQAIP